MCVPPLRPVPVYRDVEIRQLKVRIGGQGGEGGQLGNDQGGVGHGL